MTVSDSKSDADTLITIIPNGKKSEKIQPNSKNFFISFDPEQTPIRNRYFYDLSIKNKDTDQEQIDKAWWNTITDVLFQLDDGHAQNNGKTVFVAETSFDQIENRRIIVRELEQKGFRILPDHSLSTSPEAEIQKDLEQSHFSIHIVGEQEATIEIGEDKDLVMLQNTMASVHASKNKDFQRFIYIPSHISPTKSQQIKIEKIKRKTDNLIGAEIIECGIEKFKSELFQKIDKKGKQNEAVDMQGNLIYIINGVNFKNETKAIRKQLEDASIDLVAIDSFDDSLDFLHQHKRNLLMASSVLIVNSEANNHWMSSMLDDILKSYGLGKQRPFDLVGVVSAEKLQYFSQLELIHFMEINDSTSQPKLENIKTFLKAVKDARS
ncbi:MAG: hypothetical protein KDC84_00205 [Crocinitomicaceae bacterium]|nr:hypothetical protein [Crocinitomicaceae bacterium]